MPQPKKAAPVKKAAAKKAKPRLPPVEPEITGPSSEPVKPVVTLGPISAPVVRTGTQLLSGEFIMQGIELFFWEPSVDQRKWLVGALTLALGFGQNLIEKWRGRRLIGAAA